LLQQRNAHPVLQQGPHTLDPPSPALRMLRYGEAPHQALALINFGDNPVEVEVPLHGPLRMLVGHGTTMQDNRCILQGHGYAWLAAEGA
ncbi:trehalose synthase, partial [Stenotrophomonas maltophilia]|nr:trehalose synthase [Stenotrophomonas maltophilia]